MRVVGLLNNDELSNNFMQQAASHKSDTVCTSASNTELANSTSNTDQQVDPTSDAHTDQ